MSRRVVMIGSGVLGVVITALLVLVGIAEARRGEVLPGVTVADVELGGLGQEDVRKQLASLAEERSSDEVVFTHEQAEYPVDPSDIGAAVDVDALVAAALDAGRSGAFFADRIAALRGTDVTLQIDVELDMEALEARVARRLADVGNEGRRVERYDAVATVER